MKKVRGMPITGARPEYSKKRPYVPDAKETSADEEAFIKQAPMPFKDNTSLGSLPASGAGASGGISTLEPRIKSGLQHSSPGAKALPALGPVGQRKPINQSAQIGGKMGYPPPKRKAGAYPSGYKAKRNAAFFGE